MILGFCEGVFSLKNLHNSGLRYQKYNIHSDEAMFSVYYIK